MNFVFMLLFLSFLSYSQEKLAVAAEKKETIIKKSHSKQIKRPLLDFKSAQQASWLGKYPVIQQKVEKIIKKQKKDVMEDAESLFQEFPRSGLLPYKLHIRELKLFTHDNQDVVSVRMAVYTYTGGAHGGTDYYSWNWSKKEKKFLSLDEVISPEQFTSLVEQARHTLFDRQKQNDEYDKHRKAHIQRGTSNKKDFKIWNFKQNGIVIIFPEYQVGSYAAGIFEVFVSLSSL